MGAEFDTEQVSQIKHGEYPVCRHSIDRVPTIIEIETLCEIQYEVRGFHIQAV
jgi:hypothetical protein